MITPLKKTPLHDLLNKPVLFDANIFMVGIEDRISNKNCSFENMKQLYIQPLFESFTDIYIHNEVYKELDENAKKMVDTYIGKNVTIVKEDGVYGTDPFPDPVSIFRSLQSYLLPGLHNKNQIRGNDRCG